MQLVNSYDTKNKKIVLKKIPLAEWNKDFNKYYRKYGKINAEETQSNSENERICK